MSQPAAERERRGATPAGPAPGHARPGGGGAAEPEVLALQRAAGNRAVGTLLGAGGASPPPDGGSNGGGIMQRRCASCAASGADCHCEHDTHAMQRAPATRAPETDRLPGDVPESVRSVVSGGGGRPLDPALGADMEARLGADLGDVRIHTDGEAARSAEGVDALAYTVGRDVVFGPGQYQPQTMRGRELLAHELAHVLQQSRGIGSLDAARAATLESEANHAAAGALANGPIGPAPLAPAPLAVQRQPKPSSPNAAPDPIKESEFPDWGWWWIGPEFSAQPTLDQVISVLETHGRISGLSESTPTLVTRSRGWISYWSFKHPTLGIVARAYAGPGHYGSQNEVIGYHVYLFSPNATQGAKSKSGGAAPVPKEAPKEKPKETKKPPSAGQPGATKEPGKTAAGEAGKEAGKESGKEAGKGTEAGKEPSKPPAAPSPNATEALGKLKKLPPDIKLLVGGEASFKPENAEQLLRIANKLQQLSADDRELYRLIANNLTKDLDAFERSIDVYLRVKDQVRAEFDRKKPKQKEPTLEQKIADTWKGFDAKKLATMSEADKQTLARKIAAEQRNIQLEHMATHPGETAVGMVEGVVRVDKVAKGIADDVKEAADSGKSGWARTAGGVGATGKAAGWIAGIAGIVYVALLFVPGVNVVELAATALVAGLGAVLLAGVEAELRIQAAGEAKTEEEFKTQTQKAAAAQANAIVGAAMLALALVIKLVARIPLPGRFQNVGQALKAARTALLEKSGVGPALESVRSDLLTKLRAAREGLQDALAKESKTFQDTAQRVRGMTAEQLLDAVAGKDPALKDLIGLNAEQINAMKKIAGTPQGKTAAEQMRQNLIKGLEDAPVEAGRRLDKFLRDVDSTIAEVEKAKNVEGMKSAIEQAEKRFSPEEATKQSAEAQQRYIAERVGIEKYKDVPTEKLKDLAKAEPLAADELIRRYEGMKVSELKALAKKGDGTAKYVLERKQQAGYKYPAEYDLRSSNLEAQSRLETRLAALRKASGIKKTGSEGGTFGVAETDLPLAKTTFEGGSPKTGMKTDPTYKPPTKITKAQGHAEQNIVGEVRQAILDAKLTAEQMRGKTLRMYIEQEVCPTCKSGLGDAQAASGTLKQFSKEFPELTIEIADANSYPTTFKVIRIRNGEFVK